MHELLIFTGSDHLSYYRITMTILHPQKSVHYNTRETRMYVMLSWLQYTYPRIRIIVSFATSGEIAHRCQA